MHRFSGIAAILVLFGAVAAMAQTTAPLRLIAKYEMPATVKGRFDHLGVDIEGDRLFLAAETAHAVLVFDLRDGKLLHTISGIEIPHAIFVRNDLHRIYITDGGAGALKVYAAADYRLLKSIPLKADADSIGYDPQTHFLYIDNGGGDVHETFSMLSVVDTTRDDKVADIKIDGDTLEAMALEKSSPRLYVNNAAKNLVSVVDRKTRSLLASWPVTMGTRNVAMALDEAHHRLFVACRSGAIVVFDTRSGKELQSLPIAKGVDDLIFDPASQRIYASCGEGGGATYVYREQDPDHYKSLGQVSSGPGGKNELLLSGESRYFVIVPPQENASGRVDVFQVQ